MNLVLGALEKSPKFKTYFDSLQLVSCFSSTKDCLSMVECYQLHWKDRCLIERNVSEGQSSSVLEKHNQLYFDFLLSQEE